MQKRETQVGVLDKAIAILQVFSREETMLTPHEIATRTHLALPTVYRLAQALSIHGFLEQEGHSFRLGTALLRLGSMASEAHDLRRESLPHMHRVHTCTGESIEVHVRQNDAHVVLDVIPGRYPVRYLVLPGTSFPLHQGAIGQVLLAWLPPEEREVLVARSVERWGSTVPVDLPHLRTEWEEVRTQGWSVSEQEPEPGTVAIAAPLFNASEEVEGALALVAAAVHETQPWLLLVCEAATHISHLRGYQGKGKGDEGLSGPG